VIATGISTDRRAPTTACDGGARYREGMYRPTFTAGYYEAHHPRVGRVIFYATLSPLEHVTFAKAGDAPDEKWITLKPHGPDHPSYVHVKIRQHVDGTASVITGAPELRGLRLNRMKKPDDPDAAPSGGRKALRAAAKERVAGLSDQQREVRAQRQKALKDKVAEVTKRAASLAKEFTGGSDDDDKDDEPLTKVQTRLRRLERETIRELAQDTTVRAAVLGHDESVSADQVPGALPTGSGTRGYAFSAKEEAAERGFTREDARKEDDAFFQKRVDAVLATDPVKAARMIEARERMQARRDEREQNPKPKPPRPDPVKPEQLVENAAKAREYLGAMRELRAMKRQLRITNLALDPDSSDAELDAMTRASEPPKDAPWDVSASTLSPEHAREIEKAVKDAADEDLTRAFLDAATADEGMGWGYDRMRTALRAPHAAGAYAHLNNLALATYGHEVLDRTALDMLGTNAAAQLLARHLIQNQTPEDLDLLRDGLGEYHDRNSTERMRTALDEAQVARDAAAEMEVPDITANVDAVVARRMILDKRRMLEKAHHALGTALGQVEAGAAINFALGRPKQDQLIVDLGDTDVERASTNLRALGLDDGQYDFHRDAEGRLWTSINGAGMDALTQPVDPAEAELADAVNAIKDGAEDEADWLPAGFTRYPASAFDKNPPLPEAFATNPLAPDPDDDGEPKPISDRMRDAVASRLADGWNPAEVRRYLTSEGTLSAMPTHERAEAEAAISDLMPLRDADGEPIDYARMHEKHPDAYATLMGTATDWARENKPDEASFLDQQISDTDPDVHRALFMAITEDPATQVAHKPIGTLTPQDQRAIRGYFLQSIVGLSPEQMAERQEDAGKAVEGWEKATNADGTIRNPMPDKFVGLMGAKPNPYVTLRLNVPARSDEKKALTSMGLTEEGVHFVRDAQGETITLTEEGKRALKPPPSAWADKIKGLEGLNPAYRSWHDDRKKVAAAAFNPDDTPEWRDFVANVGGAQQAQKVVQQHMQGALADRFQRYHANLTKKPLRLTTRPNDHGDMLMRLQDPEEFQRLSARIKAEQDESRVREGGKFADMGGKGALKRAFEEQEQKRRAAALAQGSMFGGASEDNGGKRPDPIRHFERVALPDHIAARLGAMTTTVAGSIGPNTNPVNLIPDLTMGSGTKFVKQQRAIKAALRAKKFATFLGVGCVDGATLLTDAVTGETRSFHEWMIARRAPRVWALDQQQKPVIAQATVPFVKAFEPMFDVATTGGRTIRVAAGHKFLTPDGWQPLKSLRVGDAVGTPARLRGCAPSLPASSSALAPSGSPQDAHRSTRTPPGSTDRCSPRPRPGDARPHAAATGALACAPSPTDAHARTRSSSHADGPVHAQADTHAYPQPPRLPMTGFAHLDAPLREAAGCQTESWLDAPTPRSKGPAQPRSRTCSTHAPQVLVAALPDPQVDSADPSAPVYRPPTPTPSSQGAASNPGREPAPGRAHPPRSDAGLPLGTLDRSADRTAFEAWTQHTLGWDAVESIIERAPDLVYDITVPHHANYLAHGMWHHNSGKTAVGIGAFTEAHAKGLVRKGMFVVPSIVRNQFGEEMARTVEPGKFGWHAGEANLDERLKQYQNPDTHMVSVTHQAFRDDMVTLMQRAHGYDDADEAADAFLEADPGERTRMLKKALDQHQIPMEFLMMDEAHDSLDRAGKAESLLTAVTETAMGLASHAILATGSPVKNDASEVHSWLKKLDPQRFGDRDEFMRKYGTDMHASAEALKRLMGRYAYSDVVASGSSKTVTWGAEGENGDSPSGHARIRLSPQQRASLAHTRDAYERARRARQNGGVDVEALKVLTPRSFERTKPDQHQALAKRLNRALGALKHAAESRVVNEAPAEHNAKIQHVLKLADGRRGKGGVVFAHNRASVTNLAASLEKAGHKVATLTGSDSSEQKARIRERFKRGEIDVIVASDAAATGANLQDRGEWLVNYDLPLTYKTLEQRNARIDRLGQTRHIELHHLITDADHDTDNLDRLTRKHALAGILQGEHESLDDTGLAKYLNVAAAARTTEPPAPAEDQGGMF